MGNLKRYISIIIVSLLSIANIDAQDSLRVSLLTCTPGTDAYAHFGHTAIRLANPAIGADFVFNYGCFDASQGDFILKFIKGETDYIVSAEEAYIFLYRYDSMGNGITEQVLNLTTEEALKLSSLLFNNIQPENRGYRYNWLYDNCTTRARDMIEKAVDGQIIYDNTVDDKTARNLLHECLENDSWLKLGIDLLLGTEIDTIAPRKVQQFIPAYYENDLNNAYILSSDGSKRKIVTSESVILEEKDCNKTTDTSFTPFVAMLLLFALAIAISFNDKKKKQVLYWFDAIIHLSVGIAGIIIAYLFFFSLHPAVDTNWQVVLFNPLQIIYAVYLVYCQIKHKPNKLKYVNLAFIIAFEAKSLAFRQSINMSVHLLALMLLIRCLSNIRIEKQIK